MDRVQWLNENGGTEIGKIFRVDGGVLLSPLLGPLLGPLLSPLDGNMNVIACFPKSVNYNHSENKNEYRLPQLVDIKLDHTC